jgi:uncharacterized membrane protein
MAMDSKRVLYLDIAKGFAIIFMFTQHCMLVHEYSGGNSEHWLSILFTLLGTAPAAPVFMIIMGVFMMKSKATVKEQILRGIKLFSLGYLLNLLRIPMLLSEGSFGIDFFEKTLFNILTLNDILQLAGLSFMLAALIKKWMSNLIIPPIIFIVIFLISPFLWGLFPDNPVFSMLWGSSENIHFPFFPWVVYPLLGMYLSQYLLQPEEKVDGTLRKLALIGIVLCLLAGFFLYFNWFPLGDYARSGLGLQLLIIGFIFIWLNICRVMELQLLSNNRMFQILHFLSVNITIVYFIQWILFSWSILVFGANQQNSYIAAMIGLIVFIVTYFLVKIKFIQKVFSFTKV